MANYTSAKVLTDGDGKPIPQYLDVDDTTASPEGTFKPYTKEVLAQVMGGSLSIGNFPDVQKTQLTGSSVGYSTDTKPTNVNKGDDFLELDTKDIYFYDGIQWVKF